MRGKRPFGFTDLSRGKGLQEVIDFIVEQWRTADCGQRPHNRLTQDQHLRLPARPARGSLSPVQHGRR